MSKSVLPMFSSKSFIDSGLIFRSLIHFELSLGMVLRSALISFFFFPCSGPVFPAPFIGDYFSPLYILASIVKDKVPIMCECLSLGFLSCPIGLYFCFWMHIFFGAQTQDLSPVTAVAIPGRHGLGRALRADRGKEGREEP